MSTTQATTARKTMQRLLVRAGKLPFHPLPAIESLERNTNMTNVGNLLFQFAFMRHIHAPALCSIDHVQNPGPEEIERINASYDAFYIPLANAFRPKFARHLGRLTQLVSRLRIPVVVVGVGVQAEDNPMEELGSIHSLVREFCATVLDRSESIGVRGQFTAEYLDALGVRRVDVIGCPSMFYWGNEMPAPRLPERFSDASVSFNWGFDDRGIFSAGALLLERLIATQRSVTYFSQVDDEAKAFLYGGDHCAYVQAMAGVDRLALEFPADVHLWIRSLAEKDFTIGSRIHGSVASLLAGVPTLLMTHDCRVTELARYFNLPSLPLVSLDEPGFDLSRALDGVQWDSHLSVHAERLASYIAFLDKNGICHNFDSHGVLDDAAYREEMAIQRFPAPLNSERLDWDFVRGLLADQRRALSGVNGKVDGLRRRLAALEGLMQQAVQPA